MFNLTSIYDTASEVLYGVDIIKHGISRSPALVTAASVGTIAFGNIATIVFAKNAVIAKSRSASVGYSLLAAGSFALTMGAIAVSLDSFLRKGCVEIIKEFGNCIQATLHVISLFAH